MTGHVFVSYGRGDREIAHRLAKELDGAGFTVWWDRDIDIGVPYDRVIERALVDASCVVVLWSSDSIESDWVRAEADEGRRRGILVPALVEPVAPPLQFRLLETVDLSGWTDGAVSPAFDRFRTAIARHAPPADWLSRWREGLATHGLLQTVPLGAARRVGLERPLRRRRRRGLGGRRRRHPFLGVAGRLAGTVCPRP